MVSMVTGGGRGSMSASAFSLAAHDFRVGGAPVSEDMGGGRAGWRGRLRTLLHAQQAVEQQIEDVGDHEACGAYLAVAVAAERTERFGLDLEEGDQLRGGRVVQTEAGEDHESRGRHHDLFATNPSLGRD